MVAACLAADPQSFLRRHAGVWWASLLASTEVHNHPTIACCERRLRASSSTETLPAVADADRSAESSTPLLTPSMTSKTKHSLISPASHRAGYITLLLAIACTLWFRGISGYTEAFLFMTLFAICLVLMVQAIADLAIHCLSQVSSGVGRSIGIAVRIYRSPGARH